MTKRFPALCILLFFVASLPAQTIGPVASTVYWASKLGAKLDCIIQGKNPDGTDNTNAGKQIGTLGACTNNDAILNGILATASATNPVTLIIDGPTITAGIVGPSSGYWTVDCQNQGNGLFLANGSNGHGIRNVPGKNTYNGGTAPPTPGKNIQIRNCYYNGNRGDGTTGNSTSGTPRNDSTGHWLFGIYLENMAGVRIENVSLYNSSSFQLHLNSCTDCEVRGLRVDNNVPSQGNMDGIHIDGPSAQIRINGTWFNTNDDSIALNAAEGYGGLIRDVSIVGSHCNVCQSALRVLANEDGAGTNAGVQDVTFTNGSGTISDDTHQSYVFDIGLPHAATASADIIQSVKISNSTYTTTSTGALMTHVSDNTGEISFNNVTWVAPGGAQPWLGFGQAVTVNSFTCTACRIIRNTTRNAAAYWAQIPTGAVVNRMEFNGASVENQSGQSYSALSYAIDVQSGGAIGTLVLTNMDPTLQPTLTNGNQWARISNLYGAGIATYYRNTTFANLPPGTYSGLSASISDSATQIVGAPAAGSGGNPVQVTSNGINWTVTSTGGLGGSVVASGAPSTAAAYPGGPASGTSTVCNASTVWQWPIAGWLRNYSVAMGSAATAGAPERFYANTDCGTGGSTSNVPGLFQVPGGAAAGSYSDPAGISWHEYLGSTWAFSPAKLGGAAAGSATQSAEFIADNGVMTSVLTGSSSTALVASTTTFCSFFGTCGTTELTYATPIPFAGTARNLFFGTAVAPTNTVSVFLNVNTVNSVLTNTVASGCTTPCGYADTTHTKALAQGDYIDVAFVTLAGTVPTVQSIGAVVTPSSSTPFMVAGGIETTSTSTVAYYAPFSNATNAAEAVASIPWPRTSPCTASYLQVTLSSTQTAATTTTISVQNGGPSGSTWNNLLTGTVAPGTTAGVVLLDNSNTGTISKGDRISIKVSSNNGATASGTLGHYSFKCQ